MPRERVVVSLTIDDAKDYFETDPGKTNRRRSLPVQHSGFTWVLEAYRKTGSEGIPKLAAVLECTSDKKSDDWKCTAVCVFRVHSSKHGRNMRRLVGGFSDDFDAYWTNNYVSIEDLMKSANGYLNDNRIRITCTFAVSGTVTCKALDGERGIKRRCTDVKIVMGNRHVKASKGVLAVNSEYFEALFYGDFDDRDKEEYHLDDVHPDDFEEFLKAIYPPQAPVDADNVEALLRVANRVEAKLMLKQCERFLIEDFDAEDAIPILDKFGMSDLIDQIVDTLSKHELKEWTKDSQLDALSKDTAILLLKQYRTRNSL